ncbi:hypothetical protein BGZ49_010637 [Haplosporangium sp. Z 27]|nr:hypothetical protein BGZ49_010637 [Haplosporangium sp. Z 27]
MLKIHTALLALVVAVAGLTQASPAPPAVASKCEILTPQRALVEGRRYEVLIKDCHGRGNVYLRYGYAENLKTDPIPACSNVDFSKRRCIFTPTRPGPGFAFSAVDASGQETYSAPFKVLPKSAVQAAPAQKRDNAEQPDSAVPMKRRALYKNLF